LGTTSANDFLPVGVLRVPEPQPRYLRGYESGDLIKVNEITVPGYAGTATLEHGLLHDRISTGATEPFLLRLFTFYFPGWQAYIDGRPAPIEVSAPDGFITLWVPSGPHEVLIQFEDTPPRRLGYAISGASLLGLAVAVTSLAIRRRSLRPDRTEPDFVRLGRQAVAALAVVLVAFAGLKLASDRQGWFRVVSSGNQVLVARQTQFAEVGREFALLGYDLGRNTLRPGDEVPLTLYWKATAPAFQNYQVYVHLIGPDGRLWGQSDKLNPADFPTSRWPTDRYVRDEHRPALSPNAPPGVYSIVVGLWDATTGERLPVFDADGREAGEGIVLSQALQAQ
jgi:hypothetical protein